MIHIGRFRAIMFLVAVIGGIAFGMYNISAGFSFFFLVGLLGVVARLLNTIMLAVTGTPLFYDVKTTSSKDGSSRSY